MGTAAYGGRGFKGRTRVRGERPVGATRFGQQHNQASWRPLTGPPPPFSCRGCWDPERSARPHAVVSLPLPLDTHPLRRLRCFRSPRSTCTRSGADRLHDAATGDQGLVAQAQRCAPCCPQPCAALVLWSHLLGCCCRWLRGDEEPARTRAAGRARGNPEMRVRLTRAERARSTQTPPHPLNCHSFAAVLALGLWLMPRQCSGRNGPTTVCPTAALR